ncbi:ABC transporter ATP-binding protein [Desulfuromonas versatilis]|nr:ABC-F family ATP-binding cassette domain-containing protein [Desulfuromonas versatilis]
MNVIDISGLQKAYGARTILADVNIAVGEGEKVGLIGRNGSGKSTLLRILAGLEDADRGQIMRQRGLKAEYLPQEPVLDPALSVRQILEECLVEARCRLDRYQQIAEALQGADPAQTESLLAEQHDIQGWLDLHRGWSLDHRVTDICGKLGIHDLSQRAGELSGGQAKRVALAGVLLREPDLLMLDEPTNHLDADTVAWLEEALLQYPGAVVLVTHDRYFLDRVATRMFELEQGTMGVYLGGYGAYLEQKQMEMEQEGRTQSRLANLLRREDAWLHRGAKARTTKQKARIDRVDELRQQRKTVGSREVELQFGMDQRLGGTILELQKVSLGYPDKQLIAGLDLILRKGERIGILGPNGSGKSTLLKTILGQLEPLAGEVVLGKNTRIGYIDQDRSGLDPELYVHETLGEGEWVTVAGEKRHKIGYLESFLFSAQEQRKRVSTLSGGERARLLLAKLMLQGANLLILDEPTNDLDIPTLQVLEEALNDYPGCLLVVTHDRYFLDRVSTGILHFEGDGKVVFYEGNYETFCALKAQQLQEQKEQRKAEVKKAEPKEAPPRKRAGLSYKEKLELEQVEKDIEALEGKKAELEGLLADPSGIEGGPQGMEAVSRSFSEVEERLMALMERWEELELKKEG